MKLRSETIRLKNQIKRPLEFNQATKQIEPLEYIYICTTEHYQRPTQVQSWWSTNI
ncbi:putative BRO-like protein 2 [Cricket iridovirus]|uniref:BRO-like protein 2 n=1 Tax=Iridovirus sp. TaxID=135728 RepID=A0AAU7YC39_9VIRU|nr:putative BRO-like protein 2 [Cricket iridovirus]